MSDTTVVSETREEIGADRYRWYVLTVLGLVSVANYYDRNLISILVEPIERDLHLTDSQMGLLSGIAFAIAYSVIGIPVARLADRYGRVRVLGAALCLWSAMTMLTGRAVNFTTMVLARVGVAVGEAGGLPATHALVADYFKPQQRGKALSIIGVCGGLGLTLALAGGGLINDWRGWRAAFLLAGLPGLILAVLLLWTVKEPQRVAPSRNVQADQSGVRGISRTLWGRRSYVHLCIGLGIAAIGAYGQSTWTPAFLMRTYNLSAGLVGSYYSAMLGPATLLSIFLGGVLNDWLVKQRPSAPLWILAVTFALNIPASLLFYLIHDFTTAMALTVVTTILGNLWVAPSYALVQSLAGSQLRAIAAAIFMMVVNIVGLGLGPYVSGVLSDALAPYFGPQALAISLCLVTLTFAIGVVHFLLATRTAEADVAQAERASAAVH